MAVARRYVNRELGAVFLVVVAVLLAVIVGSRFVSYLQDAAAGKYSASSVATLLWLRLPSFLQLLLPFALYLSLLLTLGRLYAEQEFEVLQGAGAGPMRLLGWLLPMILVVAGVVGYFSLEVSPRNELEFNEFVLEQKLKAGFESIIPGVFHDYRRARRVTYAESVSADKKLLNEVFMAELPRDGRNVTLWAERSSQYVDPHTGSRFLLLRNGTRYQGRIGQGDYQTVEFESLAQRVAVEEGRARRFDMDSVPSAQLLSDPTDRKAIATLHWRIALPILTIVASIMGIGLARIKPRQGRFARLLPAFGLFVAYYVALVFNRTALIEGSLPQGFGMWLVHGTFAVLAVAFVRRSSLPARS